MIDPPKTAPMPKIERLTQMNFSDGLVTIGGFSGAQDNALYKADQALFTRYGGISMRSPFVRSGIADTPGDLQGLLFSFSTPNSSGMMGVFSGGDGSAYLHINTGNEWVIYDDVAFTVGGFCRYAQYGKMVAIANGIDNMSWYNIESDHLDRPGDEIAASPEFTLSGGEESSSYRAFYVTSFINEWGETACSEAGSALVALSDPNMVTGQWSTNISVTIAGTEFYDSENVRYTSDVRVRIYRVLSPDISEPSTIYYYLVHEEAVPASGGISWVDDGTAPITIVAPQLENSTGGLIASYLTEIDGRVWAIGAGAEYQKIYYCGTAPSASGYPTFFSGDGGFFYCAYGTSYKPVAIKRGRADTGEICNFVLGSMPGGGGRRFNILSLETTYNDQSIFQFYPEEQRGDEGAVSADGIVDYMNNIYYPTSRGFKVSGVRATYQGTNITSAIDSQIQNITSGFESWQIENCIGVCLSGLAVWRMSPTHLLVCDIENGGRWSEWYVPNEYIFVSGFGTSLPSLYAIHNNVIYRYAKESVSPDFSIADYPLHLKSGDVTPSGDDSRGWARMLNVVFGFSQLSGTVKVALLLNTRRGMLRYEVELSEEVVSGERLVARGTIPMMVSGVTAQTVSVANPPAISHAPQVSLVAGSGGLLDLVIKVNKDVNLYRWELISEESTTALVLDRITGEFVDIGVGLEFQTRYNARKFSPPAITQ